MEGGKERRKGREKEERNEEGIRERERDGEEEETIEEKKGGNWNKVTREYSCHFYQH